MRAANSLKESSRHHSEAGQPWGRVSRRTFLGMTGAALLTGCGASPALTTRPATPTPASGGVLRPAERIEPGNAGRLTLLGVLDTNTSPVRGLAWSPDGIALALSAYQDVQLWEVKTGQRLTRLHGHTDQINGIAWSPDGSMLATAGSDGTVRLWDARQPTALGVLQNATAHTPLVCVAWSPDSRKVASGDASGVVQIWEASTGRMLFSRNDPPIQNAGTRPFRYAVYGIGWSPDGQHVAANRYDGVLRIWEAQTGTSVAILQTLTGPNGLAWSPDGRMLSIGVDSGAIQLWDTQTWKNTATLWASGDSSGWTYAVPWSSDNRLLASSRQDALVQVWDPSTGKKLADLHGHTNEIWAAAWSPDGLWLASGSDDGTARLWGMH